MKKHISIALAFILTFSLAACGSPNDTSVSGEILTVEENQTQSNNDITTSSKTEEIVGKTTEEEIPTIGIKDIFAEHNIKAGTCLNTKMLSYVDQIQLIKDNFSSVTMENDMKPDSILNKKASVESGELVVEFSKDAKRMLDFAQKNNIAMRGHTLIWYSQTPNWIFYEDFDTNKALVSRDVMLERMEKYISNAFNCIEENGYTNLFYAYDIVNEAWMEDGSIRSNLWTQTIGDDYLWYAFYYADKYAPESIDLYYNDYNEQYKSQTLINFVETLKDDEGNYLIDGIGLQAHLYTSDNLTTYFDTIDRLAETGLKIQLTELDVCLGSYQHPKKADEAALKSQGHYYYNLINGILERVDAGTLNLDAITFWGYNDELSWRREYSPLLFDRKLTPKYAYYGAMQNKELSGF